MFESLGWATVRGSAGTEDDQAAGKSSGLPSVASQRLSTRRRVIAAHLVSGELTPGAEIGLLLDQTPFHDPSAGIGGAPTGLERAPYGCWPPSGWSSIPAVQSCWPSSGRRSGSLPWVVLLVIAVILASHVYARGGHGND
jgi:hypothetical protein